jgi:hypothetical protein
MVRSNEANRRYWALLHVMAEKLRPLDQTYSAEQWHLYAKSRWLGADDVKVPNGKVIVIPRSTADLDTAAFNDYMTAVEAWANEHGCYLEDAPV